MHTEAEAREKWCPYSRVGEQASGAAENRPDGSYNCIASQCMAWRWGVALHYADSPDHVNPRCEVRCFPTKALCETYYEKNSERALSGMVGGYCGLAGRPE